MIKRKPPHEAGERIRKIHYFVAKGNTTFFWENHVFYQKIDTGYIALFTDYLQKEVVLKDGTVEIAEAWLLIFIGHDQHLVRVGQGPLVFDLFDPLRCNALQKHRGGFPGQLQTFSGFVIDVLVFFG